MVVIGSEKVSSLRPGDDRFTTTINRHFMQLVLGSSWSRHDAL